MLITCVICTELINPFDEAHATDCGHIFHYHCLIQWIERSKTCPQCRCKCGSTNIRRIYFNLANNDEDVLQVHLDNANFRINMLSAELQIFKRLKEELQEMQKKSAKIILKLEEKVKKSNFMVSSLNEMVAALKNENKMIPEYMKEISKLKQEISLMSTIQTILEGSGKEVGKLLKDESDPKTLGTWVTTLRRELKHSEGKKLEQRKTLEEVQKKLKTAKEEQSILKEKIVSLESENYILQNKVKEEEFKKTGEFSQSETHLNTMKNTSRILRDNLNEASPRTAENVKSIEDAESPYIKIKSSGIGLRALRNFKHRDVGNNQNSQENLKKSSSDLGEKYTIFKKPRLDTTMPPALENIEFANSRFGCPKKNLITLRSEKKLTVNKRNKGGKLKNPIK